MRVVGLSKMAADSINCYGPAASPLIQVSACVGCAHSTLKLLEWRILFCWHVQCNVDSMSIYI